VTRWLVTGAAGLLGQDLVWLLEARGEQVTPLARADLDITDAAAVDAAVATAKPDVVINCAAWTAVDAAEAHEEAALAVNGHAVAGLAAACADLSAALVQVSTDYVFDGTARSPYAENAEPAPRSAYGRTKLAGERAVRAALPGTGYIVRTAWLYGQPTWSADVARQIHALVTSGAPAGVYHATSSGETTWFGLASEIFKIISPERKLVTPATSAACRRPAPRPAYSVLGHDAWAAAGIRPIGHWRDALHRALPDLLRAG
jgi:dTDP-4-dehydrorhamnose reductase